MFMDLFINLINLHMICLEKFSKDLGYNITTQVINTADFGIPQTRGFFVSELKMD